MLPRPRLVTAGFVLSGMLVLSLLGVVSSSASIAASGRVSAHLTKTSFPAAQAKTVKLVCKFSPASKRFDYLLSLKKGAKWVTVRSVNKTGSFKGSHTMTVKKLFGSKAVKIGQYRVKVSADANSVTRSFKVVKATSSSGSGNDGGTVTTPAPAPTPTPTPGSWIATGLSGPIGNGLGSVTVASIFFNVQADQATVSSFGFVYSYHYPLYPYCSGNDGRTWLNQPLSPIVGGQFSDPAGGTQVWGEQTGSLAYGTGHFSGTFDSSTTAHGTAELLATIRCDSQYQNVDIGPFSWTAAWQSAS